MQELVSDRRAAMAESAEPAALHALITPDLELASAGGLWREGTDEDPAWYLTD